MKNKLMNETMVLKKNLHFVIQMLIKLEMVRGYI